MSVLPAPRPRREDRGIKAVGEASLVGYTPAMSRVPILWPGVLLAVMSAVLFGAGMPFAKLLLGDGISPWLLAALLYLGSGLGLGLVRPAQRRRPDMPRRKRRGAASI